ncbi:hypothetical protein AgCh_009961 [Apium graveolens]
MPIVASVKGIFNASNVVIRVIMRHNVSQRTQELLVIIVERLDIFRETVERLLKCILSENTLVFLRNIGNSCKGVGGLLEFSGIRPERLWQVPTLKSCDVTRMYSGPVLSLFTQYQTLEYLDLSYNELQGKIPYEFGEMIALQVLELAHNQLSREIPSSLGQLKNLGMFDASHNRLQGHIPDSLSQLSFLVQIDLSNNELTGKIPPEGTT